MEIFQTLPAMSVHHLYPHKYTGHTNRASRRDASTFGTHAVLTRVYGHQPGQLVSLDFNK